MRYQTHFFLYTFNVSWTRWLWFTYVYTYRFKFILRKLGLTHREIAQCIHSTPYSIHRAIRHDIRRVRYYRPTTFICPLVFETNRMTTRTFHAVHIRTYDYLPVNGAKYTPHLPYSRQIGLLRSAKMYWTHLKAREQLNHFGVHV